jgi:hypothetical protein
VLRQRGPFRCPVEGRHVAPASGGTSEAKSGIQVKRAGETQAPTPNLSVPKPVSSQAFSGPATRSRPIQSVGVQSQAVQCPTCKHSVSAAVGQVDYVCRHCGGAFRY